MATLRVTKGDITSLDVDIIVNAANDNYCPVPEFAEQYFKRQVML